MKLYALAHKEAFGRAPAGCELHFVESGLRGRAIFKEKDLEKAASMVEEASQGIRARAFGPTPDFRNCGWCDFNGICPDRKKTTK